MKPKVKVATVSGNKPVKKVMENRIVERKPPPPEIKLDCIHTYPKSLSFGFRTAEDIRKISAVEISKRDAFNSQGHPISDGLYDPLMGPSREKNENC